MGLGRGGRIYATGVLLLVTGYLFVPRSPWWETSFQLLVGYAGLVAVLIGVRQLPRPERRPWYFIAVAVLTSATGPMPDVFDVDVVPGGGPDLADYLYFAFYPACAIGLVVMVRRLRRRIDRAALIDALTVTVGIGLLAWVYAIQPALADPSLAVDERVYRVVYPLGDLVLLTLTLLLLRSAGRQAGSAPLWISAAIGGYLLGDWAWVVLGSVHNGWDELWWTGRSINGVYLLSLAVLGLAAVRPAIRDDGLGAAAQSRLSRAQLMLLTAAVLIAPVLLAAETLAGDVVNGLAIAIGTAAMVLLVVTRLAQLLRQSERQSRIVRELSRRDELTGLPNRRAWDDELPRALERARAGGEPVTVGMLDLDHFKSYNDRYGHPAGDRLLKESAAAWHGALRRSDLLARYGGEEFIVLLPGADAEQAVAALERVRAATPGGATFSAGVATWDGAETSDELIGRADIALYAAKAAGRDRIVRSGDAGLPTVPQV